MATTTNYGWETPDDTDLVKDGALAARTTANSIDTTLKALNPSTTLGDIEYRSSTSNTNTRLGIGSTGNVLTVSGGVPVWAVPNGYTSLATGTLSSTTTTLSSISGSYRDLILVIVGAYAAGGGSPLAFTFNATTSGYWRTRASFDTAAWSVPAATEASFRPDGTNIPTTTNNWMATLTVNEYATTGHKTFSYLRGNDAVGAIGFGNQTTITAAITSIGITTVSGSSTFSGGTYTLYGVK